jgi:hypothetical protein
MKHTGGGLFEDGDNIENELVEIWMWKQGTKEGFSKPLDEPLRLGPGSSYLRV